VSAVASELDLTLDTVAYENLHKLSLRQAAKTNHRMKVYLAAAFSRQEEIAQIAVRLASQRLEITSRWLQVKKERLENAFMDVEDVRRADVLVRFTDTRETLKGFI